MLEPALVDEPYASVWADKMVPCVIVQFHAFVNRDQFKQLLTVALAYYKAHSQPARPWGWIADTRNLSAVSMEVQQWLAQDWNAQVYEAGLREMSIITSTNIMGKMATQHYTQRAAAQANSYHLKMVYYESLEAAKQSIAQRSSALPGK
ncbi:MAG: hypothetical protein ACRYG7_47350 [Janthinobacterium lividum]